MCTRAEIYREVITAWETSSSRTEAVQKCAAIPDFDKHLSHYKPRKKVLYYVALMKRNGISLQDLPDDRGIDWQDLETYRSTLRHA